MEPQPSHGLSSLNYLTHHLSSLMSGQLNNSALCPSLILLVSQDKLRKKFGDSLPEVAVKSEASQGVESSEGPFIG